MRQRQSKKKMRRSHSTMDMISPSSYLTSSTMRVALMILCFSQWSPTVISQQSCTDTVDCSGETYICNNPGEDCVFECTVNGACDGTTFECSSVVNTCSLSCSDSNSCSNTRLTSDVDTTVTCSASSSCDGTSIKIDETNTNSGADVTVNCQQSNSCDSLILQTQSESSTARINCETSSGDPTGSCSSTTELICLMNTGLCETTAVNAASCVDGSSGIQRCSDSVSCSVGECFTQRAIYPSESPSIAPSMVPSMAPSMAPSLSPSENPTMVPSNAPSSGPTRSPTAAPSSAPSSAPTEAPTFSPSAAPTHAPSQPPTQAPSNPPTAAPSNAPSLPPSMAPSQPPSAAPSDAPTMPSEAPSQAPTVTPSAAPSDAPTYPSEAPTRAPSQFPTRSPSRAPTNVPSRSPSDAPSQSPSAAPTVPTQPPTQSPSMAPSQAPSENPTMFPSAAPSDVPSNAPSAAPSQPPTRAPTNSPTLPSAAPSEAPSDAPSQAPSDAPTMPSTSPSMAPSEAPTNAPSNSPTMPSLPPTNAPSQPPTAAPSDAPTNNPSPAPVLPPTRNPTLPTQPPTNAPSQPPTAAPSDAPTMPTDSPTNAPTLPPTRTPSWSPVQPPTHAPTQPPTQAPSQSPTFPTESPTNAPSQAPWNSPTNAPSLPPTQSPSLPPTMAPSFSPTQPPTAEPSRHPTVPTQPPTNAPSKPPTQAPTSAPTHPTAAPSSAPTRVPTAVPSRNPSNGPTNSPSEAPTNAPSDSPTTVPTNDPTEHPTQHPTENPTEEPTSSPSQSPTSPTNSPSNAPSGAPTRSPSSAPTPPSAAPTNAPSQAPTSFPSSAPSENPTRSPSRSPTNSPTNAPSESPTRSPSKSPSLPPTDAPSDSPTKSPTSSPSRSPTNAPSQPPTKSPTQSPSGSPTNVPSNAPTRSPTAEPTSPTNAPSQAPSQGPSAGPTAFPTRSPSNAPSEAPTRSPTAIPTRVPSAGPSASPTRGPTQSPSQSPTMAPTQAPTDSPTARPSQRPTEWPTVSPTPPTRSPSAAPTRSPTGIPTKPPTSAPSAAPTLSPSMTPSQTPTMGPTRTPSQFPTQPPSDAPSFAPSKAPSQYPTAFPSDAPSLAPTKPPTSAPSGRPTANPTKRPTTNPTLSTESPTANPTLETSSPTMNPTNFPTLITTAPTNAPSEAPTQVPSDSPTLPPTRVPSFSPTVSPSDSPSQPPTRVPSEAPTEPPTNSPSQPPTRSPSENPSASPSQAPSSNPSRSPSFSPSEPPTKAPTQPPTNSPSDSPSHAPSASPTEGPTKAPTNAPSYSPTNSPSDYPTSAPTSAPSISPSNSPSDYPTSAPTSAPSSSPTRSPSMAPTGAPSLAPTTAPTNAPSSAPTHSPSLPPTHAPTDSPTQVPTDAPYAPPTEFPTNSETNPPTQFTDEPTSAPSKAPTEPPTRSPSRSPSNAPSDAPTKAPTEPPTRVPSSAPTNSPSRSPSSAPTSAPSKSPTQSPTDAPTLPPTRVPSNAPTRSPSGGPTAFPTKAPSNAPSRGPSRSPSEPPTRSPSDSPSKAPTKAPTDPPTNTPSSAPTRAPSRSPSKSPSQSPSSAPTRSPSDAPTNAPTRSPSAGPSRAPTSGPTQSPTQAPTSFPSASPSRAPSLVPTQAPSDAPVAPPTEFPTIQPTRFPTQHPTRNPTRNPTENPTMRPTDFPSEPPTLFPSNQPTISPTENPTDVPTKLPTLSPTVSPTKRPTFRPTPKPTEDSSGSDDSSEDQGGTIQLNRLWVVYDFIKPTLYSSVQQWHRMIYFVFLRVDDASDDEDEQRRRRMRRRRMISTQIFPEETAFLLDTQSSVFPSNVTYSVNGSDISCSSEQERSVSEAMGTYLGYNTLSWFGSMDCSGTSVTFQFTASLPEIRENINSKVDDMIDSINEGLDTDEFTVAEVSDGPHNQAETVRILFEWFVPGDTLYGGTVKADLDEIEDEILSDMAGQVYNDSDASASILIADYDYGTGPVPKFTDSFDCPAEGEPVELFTVGAGFTENGNVIQVSFSSKTNFAKVSRGNFDCSLVFDSSIVARFGENPVCAWKNAWNLNVFLGFEHSIEVGKNITLLSEAVGSGCIERLNITEGLNVTVQTVSESVDLSDLLSVKIEGSCSHIAQCDDLVLFASVPIGSVAKSLDYYWTVYDMIDESDVTSDLLSEGINLNSSSLSVQSSVYQFTSDHSYLVSVKVTNALGDSSSDSLIIYISNYNIPQMNLDGSRLRDFSLNRMNDFTEVYLSSLMFASCDDSNAQVTEIDLSWTLLSEFPSLNANDLRFDSHQHFNLSEWPSNVAMITNDQSTSVLIDLTNLELEHYYLIQVSAQHPNNDDSTAVTNEYVIIHVVKPIVKSNELVVIGPSPARPFGVSVFDAATFPVGVDYMNLREYYTWEWSCLMARFTEATFSTECPGSVIYDTMAVNFTIPSFAMQPLSRYRLSVVIMDITSEVTVEAVLYIQAGLTSEDADVEVSSPPLRLMSTLSPGRSIANSNGRLQINYMADFPEDWIRIDEAADPSRSMFDCWNVSVSGMPLPYDDGNAALAFATHSSQFCQLGYGSQPSVRAVMVRSETDEFTQEFGIGIVAEVAVPPMGGWCEVSPMNGVALDTAFTLSCDSWTLFGSDGDIEYSVGVIPLTKSSECASAMAINASDHQLRVDCPSMTVTGWMKSPSQLSFYLGAISESNNEVYISIEIRHTFTQSSEYLVMSDPIILSENDETSSLTPSIIQEQMYFRKDHRRVLGVLTALVNSYQSSQLSDYFDASSMPSESFDDNVDSLTNILNEAKYAYENVISPLGNFDGFDGYVQLLNYMVISTDSTSDSSFFNSLSSLSSLVTHIQTVMIDFTDLAMKNYSMNVPFGTGEKLMQIFSVILDSLVTNELNDHNDEQFVQLMSLIYDTLAVIDHAVSVKSISGEVFELYSSVNSGSTIVKALGSRSITDDLNQCDVIGSNVLKTYDVQFPSQIMFNSEDIESSELRTRYDITEIKCLSFEIVHGYNIDNRIESSVFGVKFVQTDESELSMLNIGTPNGCHTLDFTRNVTVTNDDELNSNEDGLFDEELQSGEDLLIPRCVSYYSRSEDDSSVFDWTISNCEVKSWTKDSVKCACQISSDDSSNVQSSFVTSVYQDEYSVSSDTKTSTDELTWSVTDVFKDVIPFIVLLVLGLLTVVCWMYLRWYINDPSEWQSLLSIPDTIIPELRQALFEGTALSDALKISFSPHDSGIEKLFKLWKVILKDYHLCGSLMYGYHSSNISIDERLVALSVAVFTMLFLSALFYATELQARFAVVFCSNVSSVDDFDSDDSSDICSDVWMSVMFSMVCLIPAYWFVTCVQFSRPKTLEWRNEFISDTISRLIIEPDLPLEEPMTVVRQNQYSLTSMEYARELYKAAVSEKKRRFPDQPIFQRKVSNLPVSVDQNAIGFGDSTGNLEGDITGTAATTNKPGSFGSPAKSEPLVWSREPHDQRIMSVQSRSFDKKLSHIAGTNEQDMHQLVTHIAEGRPSVAPGQSVSSVDGSQGPRSTATTAVSVAGEKGGRSATVGGRTISSAPSTSVSSRMGASPSQPSDNAPPGMGDEEEEDGAHAGGAGSSSDSGESDDHKAAEYVTPGGPTGNSDEDGESDLHSSDDSIMNEDDEKRNEFEDDANGDEKGSDSRAAFAKRREQAMKTASLKNVSDEDESSSHVEDSKSAEEVLTLESEKESGRHMDLAIKLMDTIRFADQIAMDWAALALKEFEPKHDAEFNKYTDLIVENYFRQTNGRPNMRIAIENAAQTLLEKRERFRIARERAAAAKEAERLRIEEQREQEKISAMIPVERAQYLAAKEARQLSNDDLNTLLVTSIHLREAEFTRRRLLFQEFPLKSGWRPWCCRITTVYIVILIVLSVFMSGNFGSQTTSTTVTGSSTNGEGELNSGSRRRMMIHDQMEWDGYHRRLLQNGDEDEDDDNDDDDEEDYVLSYNNTILNTYVNSESCDFIDLESRIVSSISALESGDSSFGAAQSGESSTSEESSSNRSAESTRWLIWSIVGLLFAMFLWSPLLCFLVAFLWGTRRNALMTDALGKICCYHTSLFKSLWFRSLIERDADNYSVTKEQLLSVLMDRKDEEFNLRQLKERRELGVYLSNDGEIILTRSARKGKLFENEKVASLANVDGSDDPNRNADITPTDIFVFEGGLNAVRELKGLSRVSIRRGRELSQTVSVVFMKSTVRSASAGNQACICSIELYLDSSDGKGEYFDVNLEDLQDWISVIALKDKQIATVDIDEENHNDPIVNAQPSDSPKSEGKGNVEMTTVSGTADAKAIADAAAAASSANGNTDGKFTDAVTTHQQRKAGEVDQDDDDDDSSSAEAARAAREHAMSIHDEKVSRTASTATKSSSPPAAGSTAAAGSIEMRKVQVGSPKKTRTQTEGNPIATSAVAKPQSEGAAGTVTKKKVLDPQREELKRRMIEQQKMAMRQFEEQKRLKEEQQRKEKEKAGGDFGFGAGIDMAAEIEKQKAIMRHLEEQKAAREAAASRSTVSESAAPAAAYSSGHSPDPLEGEGEGLAGGEGRSSPFKE